MAYFSNGSEGEILDNQCATCPVGRDPNAPCPVLLVQLNYNYEQCSNEKLREAMNCLVNKEGICQMRKVMIEALREKDESAPLVSMPAMREWAAKHGLKLAR